MSTDGELLRQYAEQHDDAAFAELVRRHLDFVYSVALRQANGDVHLAQDATQAVFVDLARKAGGLAGRTTLAGWLHTSARYAAVNAIRSDSRRRAREQEATAMQTINSAPETHWAEIGPLLDEAVGQLRETDREAVLLRFFKNLSHQEVGAALGLGEDAARKRVDRAVEKLREHFARRGVTASSAILTGAILDNSVQAAPLGLVASVTTASLAGVGGVTAGGTFFLSFFTFFMSTKTKSILAAVVVLAVVATLAVKLGSVTQPSSPTPSALPSTVAAQPAVVTAPSVAAVAPPVAQVAAPTAQPAPIADTALETPAAAVAAPANLDREVTAAMGDFVTLLEAGDFKTAAETFLQIPPTVSIPDFLDKLQQNPDFPNTVKMMIEATSAAQTVAPVYNATGDLATYALSPPVDGKTMVRWKKINGQWFVDAFE